MSRYDCIIVGSGVAGLSAALALAPHGRVLLLTKGAMEDSATRYAQGGIAAALGAEDSAAAHLKDTIDAGAGLVDEHAARVLTAGATGRIADLLDLGVPFDRENGRIALGREAAHSAFRIVHAGGDATGLYLERTLVDRVRASRVEVHEHRMVTGILTGSMLDYTVPRASFFPNIELDETVTPSPVNPTISPPGTITGHTRRSR